MEAGLYHEKISKFLQAYGEKALILLRAAYEVAIDPHVDHRFGDFSYKHLALKLISLGLSYNPVNMLRLMEKEYGIIYKSYSSHSQTWWRFHDLDAIREVLLGIATGGLTEEPRVRLLRLKYRSLEPQRVRATLLRLNIKDRLNEVDKRIFRKIVFEEISKLTELMDEMMAYEEIFQAELQQLSEIISLAEAVSRKLEEPRLGRGAWEAAYVKSPEHLAFEETERGSE